MLELHNWFNQFCLCGSDFVYYPEISKSFAVVNE